MTLDEWLALGADNGWISDPYCDVHDGGYKWLSKEQADEFEQGGDPCVLVVMLLQH